MNILSNRAKHFIKTLDWYLAIFWDGLYQRLLIELKSVPQDLNPYALRSYALARTGLRRGAHFAKHRPGRTAAVLVAIIFAWTAFSTPAPDSAGGGQAIPQSIINIASGLNPIGTADAALPQLSRMFDPLQTQPASPYGPEFNEAFETQKTLTLDKGETLEQKLIALNIEKSQRLAAIAAMRKVYSPRSIKVGQEIYFEFSYDQKMARQLEKIEISPNPEKSYIIGKTKDGGFSAKAVARSLTPEMRYGNAVIRSSVSEAAQKAGIPQPILSSMVRAFSYDIDMQRDIHPGDRIEVAYEALLDEKGQFAKYGDLVYTAIKFGKKELKIYRHKTSDEAGYDFFDESGKSIRKALLRTPIDGGRITSGFGMRRHPILGYSKMHEGVDFGAPHGTPIIAAGDGTVIRKGWNGGYGHYVEIKHTGDFRTAYGHMSRYSKDIAVGKRVRQGQVIGYVGSTGLSTGAHLHYEVKRGGRKVNPLGIRFSTGRVLAGKELQNFKLTVADINRQIVALRQGKTKPVTVAQNN